MSEKYKVHNSQIPHFITITVIKWIDLFTRKELKDVVLESLEYCQVNKGLSIHAFVIMPSHIHMIVSSKNEEIPAIIRDFKKYTSSQLLKTISELNESRKEWLLQHFSQAADEVKRNKKYKVWQDGFHPKILDTNEILEQKLDYLHNNPVADGVARTPSSYLYSSAINYEGEIGILNVDILE